MKFDPLMMLYCQHLGLKDVEPDANGGYDFTYDASISLRFLEKPKEIFVIEAMIDPNDLFPEEQDIEMLLQQHLARAKDYDEILTIDPELNRLLIYLPLRLEDMDVVKLKESVSKFLSAVSYWRKFLTNEGGQPFDGMIPVHP